MGEQQTFGELRPAVADDRLDRHPRQWLQPLQQARLEGQGYEGGTRVCDSQAQGPGGVIGPAGRPHLRDRLSACGKDQRRAAQLASVRKRDLKSLALTRKPVHRGAERQGRACLPHLVCQHTDDKFGALVTEQLAERLFMPGDPGLIDPLDKVVRGEALQRRGGKARVLAEESMRPASQIGEVAAPAARDQNLLAGFGGVIDDKDAGAGLPGRCGGEEPGPASPKDDRVVRHAGFH